MTLYCNDFLSTILYSLLYSYPSNLFLLFFFFFQAEDGILDIGVTGVQTCALPICIPNGGHERIQPLEHRQRSGAGLLAVSLGRVQNEIEQPLVDPGQTLGRRRAAPQDRKSVV